MCIHISHTSNVSYMSEATCQVRELHAAQFHRHHCLSMYIQIYVYVYISNIYKYITYVRCIIDMRGNAPSSWPESTRFNLQHAATRSNTLQHTATHLFTVALQLVTNIRHFFHVSTVDEMLVAPCLTFVRLDPSLIDLEVRKPVCCSVLQCVAGCCSV